MKNKLILVALAALVLPLSWANATVSLQFTQSNPILSSPGQNIQLTLQLVASGTETSNGLDFFFSQTAGPLANVFSITARNYTGSDYSDPSDVSGQSLSSLDNNAPTGPDNLLNAQNDVDLGSTSNSASNYVGGTHLIGTWTLSIDPGAALGTYTIQTSATNCVGCGYGASATGGGSTHDNIPFDTQASINVVLSAIPEPATWSLLGLGGIGSLGLNILRRRRS